MQIVRPARLCAALLALAPLASATTYIVDPSGAGNFTDIQTAILACVPGDVLLVQPGTYAPFSLDRGITIIGYPTVNVSGGFTIAGIPAGETGVVVRVQSPSLSVQGCGGHVIVQDMNPLRTYSVASSADVRFARVLTPQITSPAPQTILDVQGSRVELVSSQVLGQGGSDCGSPSVDGAMGVRCSSSRLHLGHSTVWGGAGGSCWNSGYYQYCGDGATGIDLQAGAEAILCGGSSDSFAGGDQGINYWYEQGGGCLLDGGSGFAVDLHTGAVLRRSGVFIANSAYYWGTHCILTVYPGVLPSGGTEIQPPVADPTLAVYGSFTPGSPATFTLDGPVGATAVLSFGRNPVVQPDPNTVIEVLVPPLRNVNLGTIGASGQASFIWPIAGVLQPGSRLIAQGSVTLPTGEVRRTNSAPVIVR